MKICNTFFQVLLISGGESLDNEEKVCKYNAGTDTNPIFLFNLANIENANSGGGECDEASHAATGFADGFGPHHGGDGDGGEVAAVAAALKEKVESAARLPDIQNTVAVRASLAQEFVRAAAEQLRVCETLIHDQHLQHQVSVASRTD